MCGLNSQPIQQKLLAIKDLDLEKALDIARSFETSAKDAKLLVATRIVHHASTSRGEEIEQEGVFRLQPQFQQQRGRGRDTRDTRECY